MARRKVVTWAREAAGLSERKACRFLGVARSTVQYRSVRPRQALETPEGPDERWTIDFVHDELATGRRFRCLAVVDDFTRDSVAIYADHSIPAERVTEVLDRAAFGRDLPATILCDNGPEFTSRHMDQWAHDRGIQLSFIRPGKPVENAFVESFNGTFREECLNEHWFLSLREARREIDAWRVDYNCARPHSSFGNLTPAEFAEKVRSETSTNLERVA